MLDCVRGIEGPINSGDTVTIQIPDFKVTAKVISANWYGGKDGWYIEMRSVDKGAYHYWKQGPDGGSLLSHEKGK